MSVNINTRQAGDVTVIDVSGCVILLGARVGRIRDMVRELIAAGNRKILLNLGNVWYIDSSGIGELVSAFTAMSSVGGKLKLLSLTKRVKELLR